MRLGLQITPPRRGTAIVDQGQFYLKASANIEKIENEFRYFQNLPPPLREFHPVVRRSMEKIMGAYLIEKIPSADTGIVFASADKFPAYFFSFFFEELERFLDLCPSHPLSRDEFLKCVESEIAPRNQDRCDWMKKSPSRSLLESVLKGRGIESLDSFSKTLTERTMSIAEKVEKRRSVFSHGDLCFSNIIVYKNRLFLIDPRGQTETEAGFRSEYYDFAKLSQCFLGGYDFINYSLANPQEEFKKESCAAFQALVERRGIHLELVRAYEACHFFSMIPFHDDNPEKIKRFFERSIDVMTGVG